MNTPSQVKFKDVLIKSCLHKIYPEVGPYAGGIVFHRYFGMGTGVGFTKGECEKLWSGLNLEDHIMLVSPLQEAHTTPAPADGTNTAADGSNTNTPTTNTPTTNTPATNTNTATAPVAHDVKPCDCIEVWWEEFQEWFGCVVTDQAPDVGDTVASLCHYDDEHRRWHNLEVTLILSLIHI